MTERPMLPCGTVKGHARLADLARTRLNVDHHDLLGVGLAAAFGCWIVVSATMRSGNPMPLLALLVTAVVSYAIGRVQGRDHPVRTAGIVVLVILSMAIVSGPAALAGGPEDPPLGYGNANGALYALGVAAAAIVARLADRGLVRRAGAVIAVVLLVLTALTTSKAATILAATILLVAVGAPRIVKRAVLIAPVLVIGAIAMTIVVGLMHGSGSVPGLESALTGRRAQLWHDAIDIIAEAPVFGVGPGGFADTSPTALGDVDARWAHSAYLQTGAELGIPGALLLIALTLFTFAALYRSQRDQRLVIICAAATAALTLHAAIDYVLHFPALVIIAAALAGIAGGGAGDISAQPGGSGSDTSGNIPR